MVNVVDIAGDDGDAVAASSLELLLISPKRPTSWTLLPC